jgi:hypothetical protein
MGTSLPPSCGGYSIEDSVGEDSLQRSAPWEKKRVQIGLERLTPDFVRNRDKRRLSSLRKGAVTLVMQKRGRVYESDQGWRLIQV